VGTTDAAASNDQQRAAKWKKNIAMHNGGLQLTSEFFLKSAEGFSGPARNF